MKSVATRRQKFSGRHTSGVFPTLLLFVVSCWPTQVMAYCLTKTCDQQNPPPACAGNQQTGVNKCSTMGTPIAWPDTCVSTSVSAYGSPKENISADQMRQIVDTAFKNWLSQDCGGGKTPNFVVDIFPDVNCTDVTGAGTGYKTTGPNYNIWIFRDNDWPYDSGNSPENAIAITTTQFSPDTGVIYDSDVEFNSSANSFTTDLNLVSMDLPSVVQHESGHFLGLAHSALEAATMYGYLAPGDATKRTLEQDDAEAICAAYPPGQLNPNCDPEPRHGFSTECEFDKGCCTVAPGRGSRRPGATLLASLLVIAAAARRGYRRKLRP